MPVSLVIRQDPGLVWHVGFPPEVWGWTDWKFAAEDGRFDGRWDDINGQYRTIYAGSSLYACLVEVMAKYRPHQEAVDVLVTIETDPIEEVTFPTVWGRIDRDFTRERLAGTGVLDGTYCLVTDSQTIATLRPRFLHQAHALGAADFDAAVLKDSAPRELTRSVSRWLYQQTDPSTGGDLVAGIQFHSRHGDDLRLWAVFERPESGSISEHVHSPQQFTLTPDMPEITRAMQLHRLSWA